MLAAIAYCLYVAGLFTILEQRGSGCWINGEYRGIWKYSDDNWALAPSLTSLQDMICTMEEYAASHNLLFSTDPNPTKCETKCLAYLKKPRDLISMKLCGNPLPWVDTIKHLGITVTNTIDGCYKDTMSKRAMFIQRSNELLQEFYFAHSDTKMTVNYIYNSHFFGSNCWDLTSRASEMFEATYNKNIKLTYNLPYPTHRNLLPVISKVQPLRLTLAKRFLVFIEKLRNSKKPVLRQMISLVENNVNTVTGRNLRRILLLTNRPTIQHLRPSDLDTVCLHGEPELWRVLAVKEILDIRDGDLQLPAGWHYKEMKAILLAACCN